MASEPDTRLKKNKVRVSPYSSRRRQDYLRFSVFRAEFNRRFDAIASSPRRSLIRPSSSWRWRRLSVPVVIYGVQNQGRRRCAEVDLVFCCCCCSQEVNQSAAACYWFLLSAEICYCCCPLPPLCILAKKIDAVSRGREEKLPLFLACGGAGEIDLLLSYANPSDQDQIAVCSRVLKIQIW